MFFKEISEAVQNDAARYLRLTRMRHVQLVGRSAVVVGGYKIDCQFDFAISSFGPQKGSGIMNF